MSGHKGKDNTELPKNSDTHANPALINLVAPIHKNTMLVNVGGRKTQALVDTGASISCISTAFLNKTNFKSSKFQNCSLKEIVGVGGERHQILGKIKIPLLISGIQICSEFFVLNELHHSVILGMDFLTTHKVSIDLDAGKIDIKDRVLSASLITTKAGFARVDRATCVPANSEIDLNVKISRRKNNEIVLLEPVSYLQSQNIGGAKCLVKVHKGKAFMRVMNPTPQDIELPANRIVASICDIDKNNVHLLDGSNPKSSQNSASVNQLHVSTDSSPKGEGIDFEVSNTNLSKTEVRTLKQFLHQNEDIFSTSLADIGKANLYKHRIETQPNAPPVRLPCYREPPHLKEETEKQVNDMLQQGIIEQSVCLQLACCISPEERQYLAFCCRLSEIK